MKLRLLFLTSVNLSLIVSGLLKPAEPAMQAQEAKKELRELNGLQEYFENQGYVDVVNNGKTLNGNKLIYQEFNSPSWSSPQTMSFTKSVCFELEYFPIRLSVTVVYKKMDSNALGCNLKGLTDCNLKGDVTDLELNRYLTEADESFFNQFVNWCFRS